MPIFASSVTLTRPPPEVFAFFLRPRNLLALAPPGGRLELVDGPELLEAGARVAWKVRRFGVSRRVVMEVTALGPGERLVEEQREGPLRRFVRTLEFEEVPEGTRLTEHVEFEPPGGMLGLTITAKVIEDELRAAAAYRDNKLPELLAAG